MKITDWCKQHGISKDAYYYRMNQVRKACLDSIELNSLKEQAVISVPANLLKDLHPKQDCTAIDITLHHAVIHVRDTASAELLAMVIEAVSHAQ